MPRNTALDEEGSEWPWREMSQVDSSGGEIGGCVWGGWAEEVGAHSQPPGELEQGGPVRCPELEAGAGSREGAVLLCQGRRLLPEGAVTLNRAARLAETIPNKATQGPPAGTTPPSEGSGSVSWCRCGRCTHTLHSAGGWSLGCPLDHTFFLPEASFRPSLQLLSSSDFLSLKYSTPFPPQCSLHHLLLINCKSAPLFFL